MTVQTQNDALPYGMKLVRYYDDASGGTVDQQCGSVGYYRDLMALLHTGALEYYDRPDGSSKFLSHVTLRVWSQYITYPAGSTLTENPGGGVSVIDTAYMDPRVVDGTPGAIQNAYKFPAALSHELGHAHSNWAGWVNDAHWGAEWRAFWERQVSSNHTTDDHTQPPWNIQGQNVNAFEQYANAYRYFFGFTASPEFYQPGTRGTSGTMNGGSDPVIQGFEDPAAHPEWAKMLRLLPETCAFWASYGLKPGTLTWQGAADGYYLFQLPDGTYTAQTDYYTWFRWTGNTWQQYYPTYNRT